MSRVTATCCAHGWWWAIAYTTRIVFLLFHGEAEYTRCTDLRNARIIRVQSLASATCAQANANRMWADQLCRAAVRLLVKMQDKYSGTAWPGEMTGLP